MANKLVETLVDENGREFRIFPVAASSTSRGGVKAETTSSEEYGIPLKRGADDFAYYPLDQSLKLNQPADAIAAGDAFNYIKFTPINTGATEEDPYPGNLVKTWVGEGLTAAGVLSAGTNYSFSRITLEKGAYYLIINQTWHKSVYSNFRLYTLKNGVYTQVFVKHDLNYGFRCPMNSDKDTQYVLQVSNHNNVGGERAMVFKCNVSKSPVRVFLHSLADGKKDSDCYAHIMNTYEGASVLTLTTQGSYIGPAGTVVEDAGYDSGTVMLEPGMIYKVYNDDVRNIRLFKKVAGTNRFLGQCNHKEFYVETPKDASDTVQYMLGFSYTLANEGTTVKPSCHPIIMSDESKILFNKMRDAEDYTSRPLRVIAFGGHNVLDMLAYVPIIAKEYGIRIDMTLFYRTSMTLQQLHDEWDTTTSHNIYHYSSMIDTGIDKWANLTSFASTYASPAQVLSENGPFDLIIFNQDRVVAPTASSFNIFDSIEPKLRAAANYQYVMGWINSPTYKTKDVPDTVLANTAAFYPKHPFGMILPGGTAWMNACTNGALAACGSSTYGKMWYTDNSSLEDGIGCYVGACACLEAIFRKFYPRLSIAGSRTRLTYTDLTTYAIPGKQVASEESFNAGMTEQNIHLAWRAAVLANNAPFEIRGIY